MDRYITYIACLTLLSGLRLRQGRVKEGENKQPSKNLSKNMNPS